MIINSYMQYRLSFSYHRLACQILVILTRMNESQQEALVLKHVSKETHTRLTVENGMPRGYNLPDIWDHNHSQNSCMMSQHTVEINGVCLPVYDKNLQVKLFSIVFWKSFCL